MSIKVTESVDFERETSTGIVLVDFYTPTCGPCKRMEPVLEECTNHVKVIKVNAADSYDLSSRFAVSAVPTLIVFRDGQEVDRLVGVVSKADILKVVGNAR
jgi:thioredoxin 1